MRTGRGRTVAIVATVLGVSVLLAAVTIFRTRLLEGYYLWSLDSESADRRAVAAAKLAEMRTVCAVPRLKDGRAAGDAVGAVVARVAPRKG